MKGNDMARARRTTLVVGLVCLPLLLAALPAVADRLGGGLPFRPDSAWVSHGPQLHRGTKVKITGGPVGQLRPGTSAPVALSLKNPNSHRIRMFRVRVRITGVVAPYADAAHPCTKADFKVDQMPKRTLQLPARRTTDLAALGVPLGAWPWLAMVNRPVNQDGCKGARLVLKFKARGLRK